MLLLSRIGSIRLWQSEPVLNGLFLNILLVTKLHLPTILSAGHKDESLSVFASIGVENTKLSFIHPLYLV